jgi:hypothetical protein
VDPGPGFAHANGTPLKDLRVVGSCVHFYKLMRNPRL